MFWKLVVFGFIILMILFAAGLVKVAGYWSRVEEMADEERYTRSGSEDDE